MKCVEDNVEDMQKRSTLESRTKRIENRLYANRICLIENFNDYDNDCDLYLNEKIDDSSSRSFEQHAQIKGVDLQDHCT